MKVQHLLHVHLVDVVGGEDEDMIRIVERHKVQVLEDSVASTLVPVLTAPHLGRSHGDEEVPVPQGPAELPAPLDVLVQRLALELDQDVDREDGAVDQVGQGEIDDAVLGREGHGRLGPVLGKRHEPLTPAPREDKG